MATPDDGDGERGDDRLGAEEGDRGLHLLGGHSPGVGGVGVGPAQLGEDVLRDDQLEAARVPQGDQAARRGRRVGEGRREHVGVEDARVTARWRPPPAGGSPPGSRP